MSRRLTTILALVLTAAILTTPAFADEGTKFEYSGVYTAWFQSQQNFRFGQVDYNDNYTVQMLRLGLSFHASELLTANTRFDLAQGWWGVDNADRSANRPGGAAGGSGLFDFKDTNFLMHVDQAYIVMRLMDKRLNFSLGRMNYSLGHKMVLDNNLDGIQLEWQKNFFLHWAKVSEGLDSLTDNETKDGAGNVTADGEDAHLFTIGYKNSRPKIDWAAYGLFYTDEGYEDGTSYLPNDLNYFRSRFAPHVTQLWDFGISANLHDKSRGLTGRFEADILFGKDDIANSSINAIQLTDVNNGDLTGYNVFLDLKKTVGPRFTVGGIFGMGSGDDDVTSGEGNVNKLRTSGFFYVTEVWEDSIMPDEEGITPQGLGGPNVRGYRELENTTLFQVNGSWKMAPKWNLFLSYTMLRATQDVFAWSVNDNGTPADASDDFTDVSTTDSSNELGQEFDWNLGWQMQPQLSWNFRGGVFMPGDAAGYLINGHNMKDDAAWETKLVVTMKF